MMKVKTTSLTEPIRGTLASCLVLITAFILSFNIVAFQARAYSPLLILDLIYIINGWGCFLLFTNRVKSIAFQNILLTLNIIGATLSIFLSWSLLTFQI